MPKATAQDVLLDTLEAARNNERYEDNPHRITAYTVNDILEEFPPRKARAVLQLENGQRFSIMVEQLPDQTG